MSKHGVSGAGCAVGEGWVGACTVRGALVEPPRNGCQGEHQYCLGAEAQTEGGGHCEMRSWSGSSRGFVVCQIPRS